MKNKDFYNFLISLAKDLNRFYKLKLNKKFKAKNINLIQCSMSNK